MKNLCRVHCGKCVFKSEFLYFYVQYTHIVQLIYNVLLSSWLTSLDNTKWLHHISGLIRAALIVVNAVDIEKRPVLVHCSDGWDRTPQIVALAEIMLDPYYRTKKVRC